jgi:hypothetical protein
MLIERRTAKVFRSRNGHEGVEIAEIEVAHCPI